MLNRRLFNVDSMLYARYGNETNDENEIHVVQGLDNNYVLINKRLEFVSPADTIPFFTNITGQFLLLFESPRK